jgi:hypothetical protein
LPHRREQVLVVHFSDLSATGGRQASWLSAPLRPHAVQPFRETALLDEIALPPLELALQPDFHGLTIPARGCQ